MNSISNKDAGGFFKSYSHLEKTEFKQSFCSEGFVYLPDFLPSNASYILSKVENELSGEYMRKDFLMPQSDFSPRRVNVIGGKSTNKNHLLMDFYSNSNLMNFISFVVSREVVECDQLMENIIFTSLSCTGDTHGWHIDDYPIALIMGIKSPEEGEGGEVEFYNLKNELTKIHLKQSDAYLMRSDLVKHRVAPLKKDSLRTILNFTYSFPDWAVNPNGSANLFCE